MQNIQIPKTKIKHIKDFQMATKFRRGRKKQGKKENVRFRKEEIERLLNWMTFYMCSTLELKLKRLEI